MKENQKTIENQIAADWHFEKGCELFENGQTEEAVMEFTLCLEANPTEVAAYLERIEANRELGDWPWILSDYGKVIALEPKCQKYRLELARVKFETGDYEGALADVDRAIELGVRNFRAWELRGEIQENLKNRLGAINDYSKAWYLCPHHSETLLKRGLVKEQIGDEEGALADYSLAENIKPKSIQAKVCMGDLFFKQKRFADALACFADATKINRRTPYIFWMRGICKIELTDYQGAEKDMSIVIRQDPEILRALFNRAYARAKLKKIRRALDDLNQLLELDPEFEQADLFRAELLEVINKSGK